MKKLKQILQEVKTNSPILYGIVLIHFILAVVCCVGLMMDDRMLMGVNIWIKPLKFSISGGIYIFTVGYITSLFNYSKKRKNIINNWVSWTLLIEIIIIVTQAARGVQSHYNQSSPLDGILFGMMGILIAINVVIMFILAVDTLRFKMRVAQPVQWAVFFGWIIVIFGSWVGGQMISQMAHNVGVPDGGAGLPLVNWSTIGGDLRIAHFFGLHGIQIVPLFAFWITLQKQLIQRNKLIIVAALSIVYAVCIGYIFYQAKLGIPLIAQ